MGNCSKHPKEISGISNMQELAYKISELHYESLSQLLFELQTKLHNDSMQDLKGGRFKLGQTLQRASEFVCKASNEIEHAWQICKPIMDKNKTINP